MADKDKPAGLYTCQTTRAGKLGLCCKPGKASCALTYLRSLNALKMPQSSANSSEESMVCSGIIMLTLFV